VPQFFIKSSNINGDSCIIDGDDYRHLSRVRRVKTDDIIQLVTEDGDRVRAKVREISDSRILADILPQDDNHDTSVTTKGQSIDLTLYMSILKGKKFDLVIQKAVEVGVSRIVPVVTDRTVSVPHKDTNKIERWNRIAVEAAKQSMRVHIPVVENILKFDEALNHDSSDIKIIAHLEGAEDLKEYLRNKEKNFRVSLFIGPEGGFSENEIKMAEGNDWKSLSFGFSQLRAETAAISLSSILVYEWS